MCVCMCVCFVTGPFIWVVRSNSEGGCLILSLWELIQEEKDGKSEFAGGPPCPLPRAATFTPLAARSISSSSVGPAAESMWRLPNTGAPVPGLPCSFDDVLHAYQAYLYRLIRPIRIDQAYQAYLCQLSPLCMHDGYHDLFFTCSAKAPGRSKSTIVCAGDRARDSDSSTAPTIARLNAVPAAARIARPNAVAAADSQKKQ